jgi:hypothetical protein
MAASKISILQPPAQAVDAIHQFRDCTASSKVMIVCCAARLIGTVFVCPCISTAGHVHFNQRPVTGHGPFLSPTTSCRLWLDPVQATDQRVIAELAAIPCPLCMTVVQFVAGHNMVFFGMRLQTNCCRVLRTYSSLARFNTLFAGALLHMPTLKCLPVFRLTCSPNEWYICASPPWSIPPLCKPSFRHLPLPHTVQCSTVLYQTVFIPGTQHN